MDVEQKKNRDLFELSARKKVPVFYVRFSEVCFGAVIPTGWLFPNLNAANQGEGSNLALHAVHNTQNHKDQGNNAENAYDANKVGDNADDHIAQEQYNALVDVIFAEYRVFAGKHRN